MEIPAAVTGSPPSAHCLVGHGQRAGQRTVQARAGAPPHIEGSSNNLPRGGGGGCWRGRSGQHAPHPHVLVSFLRISSLMAPQGPTQPCKGVAPQGLLPAGSIWPRPRKVQLQPPTGSMPSSLGHLLVSHQPRRDRPAWARHLRGARRGHQEVSPMPQCDTCAHLTGLEGYVGREGTSAMC